MFWRLFINALFNSVLGIETMLFDVKLRGYSNVLVYFLFIKEHSVYMGDRGSDISDNY